jgi:hypothetical protein
MEDEMDMVSFVAQTIDDDFKKETSLEDRLRVAMRAASKHWMVTDRDTQLKGAVIAVMTHATPEEQNRIKRSLEAPRNVAATLKALVAGVPVDLSRVEAPDADVIPFGALWREATAKPAETGDTT